MQSLVVYTCIILMYRVYMVALSKCHLAALLHTYLANESKPLCLQVCDFYATKIEFHVRNSTREI